MSYVSDFPTNLSDIILTLSISSYNLSLPYEQAYMHYKRELKR